MSQNTKTQGTKAQGASWDASAIPRNKDGQFREYLSSRPEGTLSGGGAGDGDRGGLFAVWRQARERWRGRAKALVEDGYVSAASSPALHDPRWREGIEDFWEGHFADAEQAPARVGHYGVMPDDFTPSGTGGRALSGRRRTHRMAYTGPETTVRMPSATSIRAFAKQSRGGTFDVPVDASYPGGTVSGYVRVTPDGPGRWSVSGLGMDVKANGYVSESVQAVLEARCVSRALKGVPDMLARRADRLRSAGVGVGPVAHSDLIRSAGYNRASGDMVVSLNGRTYGYRNVPEHVYEQMLHPTLADRFGAGVVYNRLVKGSYDSFKVQQCPKCSRFAQAGHPHRCPSAHKGRTGAQSSYSKAVRAHQIALAG